MRALFVLSVLAVTPAVVAGQTATARTAPTFGIAAGVDLSTPRSTYVPFRGDTPGFAINGFAGKQLSPRTGMRLEGSLYWAPIAEPSYVGVLCEFDPPPDACCGICPSSFTNDFAAALQISLSGVLMLTPPATSPRLYLLVGSGFLEGLSNATPENIRLVGSAGLGCSLPAGVHSRVFFEARYEAIVHSSPYRAWMLPVTVGWEF
jgi:hypothetical protein